MSWLDTLFDRGNEARQLEAPATPAAPVPPPEIKQVWFQTRAPREGVDLGEIYPAFYSVADGVLTMHADETGKPPRDTGDELKQLEPPNRYRLRAGEDPRQAAGRLGKKAWVKARGESDFDRPLHYGPLGVV